MNGTNIEKARFSFKLLANKKNTISLNDIEGLVYEVSQLWNSMTGSRVLPNKEFVNELFNLFDSDKDG